MRGVMAAIAYNHDGDVHEEEFGSHKNLGGFSQGGPERPWGNKLKRLLDSTLFQGRLEQRKSLWH